MDKANNTEGEVVKDYLVGQKTLLIKKLSSLGLTYPTVWYNINYDNFNVKDHLVYKMDFYGARRFRFWYNHCFRNHLRIPVANNYSWCMIIRSALASEGTSITLKATNSLYHTRPIMNGLHSIQSLHRLSPMCQKRKAQDAAEGKSGIVGVYDKTLQIIGETQGHAPATLDHDRERCLCYLQYVYPLYGMAITAWMLNNMQ